MADKEKRYEITTRSGEIIYLDKATCIKYVANGQNISDSEYNMFFQLCKNYQVNPFLKEAYLLKYGNEPATIIVDYKVLQQNAEKNPQFKGMETGVLVYDTKNEKSIERAGAYILPNEKLIAGWCKVLRKDREIPTIAYAMFDEFAKTKKDGTLNSQWSGKPVFMIVKVAKAQALREAFPDMFGSNIYTEDERATFDETKNEKDYSTTVVQEEVIDMTENSVVVDDDMSLDN